MNLPKNYLDASFPDDKAGMQTREKFTFAMNSFALAGGVIDYIRAKQLRVSRSAYYRYYKFLQSRGGEYRTPHGTVICDCDKPLFFVRPNDWGGNL